MLLSSSQANQNGQQMVYFCIKSTLVPHLLHCIKNLEKVMQVHLAIFIGNLQVPVLVIIEARII
jgi:hypothetical protein